MENKNYSKEMLSTSLNDNLTFSFGQSGSNYSSGTGLQSSNYSNGAASNYSCWDYWQHYHYPQVIYQSYPVYLRNRAEDKGKQAFEIIKVLKDKRFINLEKVGDFIDLMDELIKIL